MLFIIFAVCTIVVFLSKESDAAAGTATNLAGTGTAGYNGDGGQATSAQLNFPTGVWSDSNGNVYFVDNSAYVARRVDTSGIITTFGGTGTAANANAGGAFTSVTLNAPWGIVGDTNGYIYISDTQKIWKYDRSSGNVAIYAGTSSAGSNGNNGQATSAQVTSPAGMWLTTGGVLYFAESGSTGQTVRAISSSGIITLIAGTTGSSGSTGDGAQATSAKLSNPAGVYVNTNGVLYIADRSNLKIRYVSSGIINVYAGGGSNTADGFLPTATILASPYDVRGDTFGNIYICETSKVRVVDYLSGLVSTYLTGLSAARGVWIDGSFSRTLVAQNAYIKTSAPFTSDLSPTAAPSTISPSATPSVSPTSAAPSTIVPTATPTADPSATPTAAPTSVPTVAPTYTPSTTPSTDPSAPPSQVPTADPTVPPTAAPSASPSTTPSTVPSQAPTAVPNASPTTPNPTTAPSPAPSTTHPSIAPGSPTPDPTTNPTQRPSSASPSRTPTVTPTALPSQTPTASPTNAPTYVPTMIPTSAPTAVNQDTVQITATPRVKFIYGQTLNDLSLDTLIEAFQNISVDAQTTVITSTSLVSSSQSLIRREPNIRSARSIALATTSRTSYTHDISFMSSYVMTYHLGYTSQQIATMKTTTIRQAIESGQFETVLRSLARARNATQLLNETSNEVMSITSSIITPSSSSGSDGTDLETIIVVVCVLGGALLLCLLLFFYKKYQQEEDGKRTNKVYIATSYDKEEETI